MKKTALVTGASGGIGLELARIFAAHGHNVIIVARSKDKLQQLQTELKGKNVDVHLFVADLSNMQEVEALHAFVKQHNLQVDYLVNNAGFGEFGMFYETDWNKEAMMIDLNVKSLTYMTKLFLKDMLQRKQGRIMNVASTAAFVPGPTMAVYYATKAFVLSFSEAIANELENTGITVTALCPGATESGFQKAASLEESKLVKGKKLPTSAEVAQYGYDAIMNGTVVAIHGMKNKLLATSIRFTPRALVRKIVRSLQNKAD